MVRIKKKLSGKQEYYYLEHAYREGSKVKKKELYLGKAIPKDIEEIKKNFLSGIYKEKFYKTLDIIKKGYSADLRQIPESVREKEILAFAIKFTYDTQRIEGSKLTLRETADLLGKGITPTSKPAGDAEEAEAHKRLFYEMLGSKKELSLQLILEWHRKLFQARNLFLPIS